MTHVAPEAFAAFIGIDWADAQHDVCLQTADATKRECQLEHTPRPLTRGAPHCARGSLAHPWPCVSNSTKALWSLPRTQV